MPSFARRYILANSLLPFTGFHSFSWGRRGWCPPASLVMRVESEQMALIKFPASLAPVVMHGQAVMCNVKLVIGGSEGASVDGGDWMRLEQR